MGKLAQLGGQYAHFVECHNFNSNHDVFNDVLPHQMSYLFCNKYLITWIRNDLLTFKARKPENRRIYSKCDHAVWVNQPWPSFRKMASQRFKILPYDHISHNIKMIQRSWFVMCPWSETRMESERMLPQQSLMQKLDFSLPQYRISFESPWIVYFFST